MNEEEAVGVEGRGQNARDWSDGIGVRSQLVRCGQGWGTQRSMDIPLSLFIEQPQFICPFCTQSPSEWDSLLSPSSSAPQLVACPQQQWVVSKELGGVFAAPRAWLIRSAAHPQIRTDECSALGPGSKPLLGEQLDALLLWTLVTTF